MKGFLLDENLPTRLTFSPSLPVSHARDFGGNPTDSELWDLAGASQWVIVTKDTDFSHRILLKFALGDLIDGGPSDGPRNSFHLYPVPTLAK